MAEVIAAAITLRNRTPLGDHGLLARRNDHIAFLNRLASGAL